MRMMVTEHVMHPMIKVPTLHKIKTFKIFVSYYLYYFLDGEIVERGCSTKHNICDDLSISETMCKYLTTLKLHLRFIH